MRLVTRLLCLVALFSTLAFATADSANASTLEAVPAVPEAAPSALVSLTEANFQDTVASSEYLLVEV
jgi:hypothetical protein